MATCPFFTSFILLPDPLALPRALLGSSLDYPFSQLLEAEKLNASFKLMPYIWKVLPNLPTFSTHIILSIYFSVCVCIYTTTHMQRSQDNLEGWSPQSTLLGTVSPSLPLCISGQLVLIFQNPPVSASSISVGVLTRQVWIYWLTD